MNIQRFAATTYKELNKSSEMVGRAVYFKSNQSIDDQMSEFQKKQMFHITD